MKVEGNEVRKRQDLFGKVRTVMKQEPKSLQFKTV